MRPVNAVATRNLVRVKTTTIALHGGKRALADFHVTPPLGKNIVCDLGMRIEAGKEGRDVAASAMKNSGRLCQSVDGRTSVSVCED